MIKIVGRGHTRIVYLHPENPDWVIKKAITNLGSSNKINHNKLEWDIWNAVKNTQFSVLFCPCIELTNDNDLIMAKCQETNYEDGHDHIKINKVIVEDSKRAENFGVLNGKKVLIDYGHSKNIRLLKELRKKGG